MKDTSSIPSPCYVLEEDRLVANLEIIDRVKREAEVEIILAFKGFAMWSAFPIIKRFVSGATASSLNEVKLCAERMDTKAHTYCVAYHPDEFEEIARCSSHVTFNSLDQYHRFIDKVPFDVKVGLRVNPERSDVETELYNPSSPHSRLGIHHTDLKELPDRVDGLHFHVLCESDVTALKQVLEAFEMRFAHLMEKVKWVNMGGGHLMTRKGYAVEQLIATLKTFRQKHDVEVILEPGSAFAWETGDLHTTVMDVVNNGGIKTAIIDASFTCHMPDCLEMPYRPNVVGAAKEQTPSGFAYRLGGVSCLAGDYLDEYWFENEVKVGDPIVFNDMIHYTMVKTTMFNGIKHPSIGILRSGGQFELVKEFGYEDYRDRLS